MNSTDISCVVSKLLQRTLQTSRVNFAKFSAEVNRKLTEKSVQKQEEKGAFAT